jgi:dihydroxyacetone kinase
MRSSQACHGFAAQAGAEATKGMTPAAGRSSYVSAATAKGIPDPGAKAVAIWLSGALAGLP